MATMESREVGPTEHSWCRALPGGTGVTVLALLLSKPPSFENVENALHKLQNSHPILRSKLQFNPSTRKFSFVTPTSSTLSVKSIDLRSTLRVLDDYSGSQCTESLFHKLIEHELNLNPWEKSSRSKSDGCDLFEAKVYEIVEGLKWAVVMKAHTAVCDRTAGETVLRDLVRILRVGVELENRGKGEVKMGIEEYIPVIAKGKKSIWARGMNMLGYSLNAFRLSNIDFVDTRSTRRTQLFRLRLEPEVTTRLLEECTRRESKLCGALAAAALLAARRSKRPPEGQFEKYSVATLIDCRSLLDPPLTTNDVGFYHSAIVNTHDINGKEQLWQLAKKTFDSFNLAKNVNKHFSDMADLTFLMCRAIENPSLTPSSSLRTSLVSVFEDVVVHNTDDAYEGIGVEDYMVCSSVHGVGPTLALFGTIRDGGLDFGCAYPGPLHSREQMEGLVNHMKRILVEAS